MSLFKSLLAALSMYTIIPLPYLDWDEKSLKYMLALYPVSGLVIGGAQWLLAQGRSFFFGYVPGQAYTALATVLPILITGGIHMDGYMDTWDAIGSRAPLEKKLSIMKDPNIGAFGALALGLYLVLSYGGYSMISTPGQMLYMTSGYVLARVNVAIALMSLPAAAPSGSARTIKRAAGLRGSYLLLYVQGFLAVALGALLYGLAGGIAILISYVAFILMLLYLMRTFKGLSGDMAGWLLCMYELFYLWIAGFICHLYAGVLW